MDWLLNVEWTTWVQLGFTVVSSIVNTCINVARYRKENKQQKRNNPPSVDGRETESSKNLG
jgi:hypothetical protein